MLLQFRKRLTKTCDVIGEPLKCSCCFGCAPDWFLGMIEAFPESRTDWWFWTGSVARSRTGRTCFWSFIHKSSPIFYFRSGDPARTEQLGLLLLLRAACLRDHRRNFFFSFFSRFAWTIPPRRMVQTPHGQLGECSRRFRADPAGIVGMTPVVLSAAVTISDSRLAAATTLLVWTMAVFPTRSLSLIPPVATRARRPRGADPRALPAS